MVAPVRWATPGTEVDCARKPSASAIWIIQVANTPPPCPPSAAMQSLIGRSGVAPPSLMSERVAQAAPLAAPLEESDDRRAQPIHEAIPARRVVHELGAVEGRAQHRGVRHFPAHSA